MLRRPYASRGDSRASNRGFGNRGGRGGYRGAYRGSGNPAGRAPASFATLPTTTPAPQRSRPRLGHGCFLPKQIFRHFNPSAASCDPDRLNTINSSEENPNGAGFALIYVANQPHWMTENTIYIKSRLELLPEYAAKKTVLLEQHKEPSHEEMMERLTAKLTESIKFDQYGIADGPDMECFDEEDNISSLLVPGDWMSKSCELPRFATVDTPSVKYNPAEHEPIAVYAGYGADPDKTGFKFVSWFLIEEIELFAANSVDLARKMHDKKWSADMDREWAAVKLRRVEKGEGEWRPYPFIKRGAAKPQVSGSEQKEVNGDVPAEGVEEVGDPVAYDGKEASAHDEDTAAVCGIEEQTTVNDSETHAPEHDVTETLVLKEEDGVIEVMDGEVKEEVGGKIGEAAEEQVEEQVGETVKNKVKKEVKEEIKATVKEEDKAADKVEVKEDVKEEVEEEVKEEIKGDDEEGVKGGETMAGETKEEEHDEPARVMVDKQAEEIKDGEAKKAEVKAREVGGGQDQTEQDQVEGVEMKKEMKENTVKVGKA